ncbi:phage scaffolding protein [Mesobacillus stamsii]|uniref:Chromosome segregation ATPase n=1 Tax=Mesobacillus stamsii TaxID=225347 RepID=A0ABU0FS41_9BACI|nr:phage scaffolding protein [Mesobacillus stamsii]MDQ0412716.1 chromosome segregation ATPase [Mesobacillus stamsii]
MKRDFLEGLGLEKEAIDKIMAEHGKTVEAQKQKANELSSSLDDLKKQLDARDADLKDLKKKAEGNEELQTKFADLEKQYKVDKEAYETKLKDAQLASAVKLALAGKVHDADLVSTLLDKATIEVGEDGSVKKGLDEQIKTLKESKPFLFVPEQPAKPSGFRVGGTKPGTGTTDETPGSLFAKQANEAAKVSENNPWK